VTKTQSAGPISCLEHRATRVLHCTIVTRATVLMFPLLLQTIISNQMRPRRLRGAWFSRLLRHPARRRTGSILSPGTHTGCWMTPHKSQWTRLTSEKLDLVEQKGRCVLEKLYSDSCLVGTGQGGSCHYLGLLYKLSAVSKNI